MKAVKIIAIVLAAVGVLVGGAVAYLFASFDSARVKQEIAAGVLAKTGRTLTMEGELALSIWPNVGLKLGRTSLSEPGSTQKFAHVESARIAVAVMPLLSKQVSVKAVEIDGLAANLVKHKDGSLNINDLTGGKPGDTPKAPNGEEPAKTAPGAVPRIDIQGIRITKGQLDWRDEQSGKHLSLANLDLTSGPLQVADGRVNVEAFKLLAQGQLDADTFTLSLEAPRLAVAPDGTSGETLKLLATLDGKGRKLAVTLALKGVAGDGKNLKIEKFSLDADAAMGDTHAVAQLASPVALDLASKTVALPQLAGKLDLTHPKLPMKTLALPLAGGAEANFTQQTASLRLATQADASQVKARVDIGKFTPLALVFDLDIDQLDLDKYLPPAKAGESGGAGNGGASAAGAAPEGRINLAALKPLNLKGTVKIGQLVAKKLKASAIRVQLDAQGGRLNVAPMAANLYDGRLEGALAVDANSNRFSVRQNLTGVQINPLLKDLLGKDMIEGKGNVSVDVTTQGDTVPVLKKALAGAAKLALADGAIKGINIAQKLRDAKAALQGGKDVTAAGDGTQKTDFSELSASFRIASGVAHNDDLMAKSPLLRLTGSGDIDVGNDRFDYLLKASLVNTATGQGGKDMDSLKGITVPVRLSGPFAQPAWKLELGGLVQEAAKAKLDEKKDELKQKAVEQLQGQLKGLFK